VLVLGNAVDNVLAAAAFAVRASALDSVVVATVVVVVASAVAPLPSGEIGRRGRRGLVPAADVLAHALEERGPSGEERTALLLLLLLEKMQTFLNELLLLLLLKTLRHLFLRFYLMLRTETVEAHFVSDGRCLPLVV
jgi:hypothetical protein